MRIRAVALPLALMILCGAAWSPAGAGRAGAQTPEEEEALRTVTGTEDATPAAALEAAKTKRRAARAVLAGPVDADAYVVGPGDLLSLEYAGRATGSTPLPVDGEGRVRVPNLGLVTVGGKSLTAVREELLRRLRPYLPGATLDVRLLEPRTFKVFVLGEVKEPGVVEVVGSARVLEAIEAVGGGMPTTSTRNVRVLRRDGRVAPADLERFRRTGDWDANPYLEDGDRVVVPIAIERIGVFGAVGRPDFYEFRAGDSLGTALRLAGGLLPEARRDSLLIVRFVGASGFDTLYAGLDGGLAGVGPATRLSADDRIFVRPQAEWRPARQVNIIGEVRFPGTYAIEDGKSRISDVLRWAGGFTANAARRNVRLERRPPETGDKDVEFERLSRLSRAEMTNSEYQTYRSKLAVRQAIYVIDFSTGVPQPPEADVMLRDGDRLEVGRLELSVRVDGSVQRPGFVAYEPGRTVEDYIEMAGGPARRGNVRDARLTRAGSNTPLYARDVRRAEPGDFIWVPEKKDTAFWTVFRDTLIIAGQIATIILVIDEVGNP